MIAGAMVKTWVLIGVFQGVGVEFDGRKFNSEGECETAKVIELAAAEQDPNIGHVYYMMCKED